MTRPLFDKYDTRDLRALRLRLASDHARDSIIESLPSALLQTDHTRTTTTRKG